MNIFAIIVTYNPDWSNIDSLTNILLMNNIRTIVVDNGSDYIKNTTDGIIKPLNFNYGIAYAQNIGIKQALLNGAEWIIFFDHDTTIDQNFINQLKFVLENTKNLIIAPIFIDKRRRFIYPIVYINKNGTRHKINPIPNTPAFNTTVAISSGTAVKSELFYKIGLFDERLFIDYVDTEWCLRCMSKNVKIAIQPSLQMEHTIGDKIINLILIKIPVHSPKRRYYRIRNSILLLRYNHVPKLLVFREIIIGIFHQIIILMLCPNKKQYFSYFIKAIIAGLKGNHSSIDSPKRGW